MPLFNDIIIALRGTAFAGCMITIAIIAFAAGLIWLNIRDRRYLAALTPEQRKACEAETEAEAQQW